jgi:DNA-binding HxlR family transcriptional regulator
MSRKRFDQMNCGIAQALEAFGDWWTLLIVRDAFFGARRFGDFQRSLGIAKNILSARLAHLVEHGIFERVDVGSDGERFEYRLTAKGEALLTVLTVLREWSDDGLRPRQRARSCATAKRPAHPGSCGSPTRRAFATRRDLRTVSAQAIARDDLLAHPRPGVRPALLRAVPCRGLRWAHQA